ncbi:MAG: hypothetical protein ACREAM_22065, partial [Blastocatellia bacterium]
MVEPTPENLYQGCKIQELAASIPPWQSSWVSEISVTQIVIAGSLFLVLLALSGRFSRRRAVSIDAGGDAGGAGAYRQPMGHWKEEAAPSVRVNSLAVKKWMYLAAAVSILLVAAGIHNNRSLLTGLGVVGLAISWVVTEYKLLVEGLVFGAWRSLARAVVARDRKGRRGISAATRRALSAVDNLEEVLNSQPDSFLLTLAATNSSDNFDDIVTRCLRPATPGGTSGARSLAAHPACTVLTRVDFAVGGRQEHRAEAVGLLPRSLWPSAIKTLARSEHGEARAAAARCDEIPREVLIEFCRADPDAAVWQAAWSRLKSLEKGLQPEEAISLSASIHSEVRLLAVESNLLPRELVLNLCGGDRSGRVRKAAWERLNDTAKPGAEEIFDLSYSEFSDARLRAVRSGRLPARRLRRLRWRDPDPDVRQEAFDLTSDQVTSREARRLIRSSSVDVRIR